MGKCQGGEKLLVFSFWYSVWGEGKVKSEKSKGKIESEKFKLQRKIRK